MFIDRWMDKEIRPFAETWMDLETVTISQVRQRKTNIIWYYIHVESKYGTTELVYKTETDSQT